MERKAFGLGFFCFATPQRIGPCPGKAAQSHHQKCQEIQSVSNRGKGTGQLERGAIAPIK